MEILRGTDPVIFFQNWMEEARLSEKNDPEAAALATVSRDGQPSVRMVLVKKADDHGFRFFTNLESRKGQELAANPKAALCFHWKSLLRQVRVEGAVLPVAPQEADEYYNSRHPLSRLGAWASDQSKPLASRAALIDRVDDMRAKYGMEDIPRPPFWSGFRLVPQKIEFWQQGEGRLHDRFLFVRKGNDWDLMRLNP